MAKIVAVDLFCGAGGLTRGLLDAGIDVVCGIDSDEKCSLTYESNNIRENGRSAKYIKTDIRQIDGNYIKNIFTGSGGDYFMLAGCAPCQPFSRKNVKRNTDGRVNLLTEFARLIEATKPDFVFMENVPDIEKIHSEILSRFTDVLKNKGYFYDSSVINAKDYGVPQNRKRFVLIASKLSKITIPLSLRDGNTGYITVKDAIGDTDKFPPINAGESHEVIFNHRCSNLSKLNLKRLEYTPIDGGSRKSWPNELVLECHKKISGHWDAYGRMRWDSPAPTLTTRFSSITTGRYAHPEQNRAISMKEGASIQSFPYEYKFYGNVQEISRQIGNAVPPKMAREICKVFMECND